MDATAARHRLFHALAELFGALRIRVLVVEDAQWADEATLEFLLFLTARFQPSGVSLVVTYRPEEVAPASLLLRLPSRLPTTTAPTRLALAPLSVADTAALVSSMLDGEHVSEAFASFLHDRTGGVPLLIEESVRLLAERADLIRRNGEWVRRSIFRLQVPPTVRVSVLERVQRLSDEAQRLLQAAAVLVEPTDETVVCQAAGLDGAAARAGLTEAVGSGLLRDDDTGVAFRHGLASSAVYEAIPRPQRRELHRRAGRVIEAVDPGRAVQLVRHFREAGDHDKWCHFAEVAATVAVDKKDPTTAVILLNDLLSSVTLPADTCVRLARQLGRAALSRPESADRLHHQVIVTLRKLLDEGLTRRQQAEIRNPLGRLLGQVGEIEACRAELERAIADLDRDSVDAVRAMAYLGWPHLGPWPAQVHRRWLRRVAAAEARVPSPADRIALASDRAFALLMLGDESGWAVAESLPTGTGVVERRQVARSHANVAAAAILWGRYAEARQRLEAGLRLVDSDGYLRIRRSMEVMQANLAWLTGAWEGLAERVATLLAADDIQPVARLHASRIIGRLEAARGSRCTADDRFRDALEEARRLGVVDDALEPAAALARSRLAEGDASGALSVTDGPMDTVWTKQVWVWATEIAPVRVDALIEAGRAHDAGLLVQAFARGLRGRDAPAPRAALATCRAALTAAREGPGPAASAFATAARAWEALPRPYDALLARERQANCLLAAGRLEAGVRLLSTVWHGLRDLGATGDADRLARHLREYGVDTRRSGRGGRPGYGDRLSPRELEVVQMLVTGRTDREIAEALFLSPRTVGAHLASARRKLHAASRTALAVAAVEAGLVDRAP